MDTSCTNYRTELSAFLDGQLDVKDQSDVQGHLNSCENCSDELETLKKLTKFLNDQMHPDNVAMPEIWNGIQAQMPVICAVMEEDLSAYLDGELPPAQAAQVAAHLSACWVCRARKQGIEEAIVDFVRLHRGNLDPLLPPSAGPRAVLKAQLAEMASMSRRFTDV